MRVDHSSHLSRAELIPYVHTFMRLSSSVLLAAAETGLGDPQPVFLWHVPCGQKIAKTPKAEVWIQRSAGLHAYNSAAGKEQGQMKGKLSIPLLSCRLGGCLQVLCVVNYCSKFLRVVMVIEVFVFRFLVQGMVVWAVLSLLLQHSDNNNAWSVWLIWFVTGYYLFWMQVIDYYISLLSHQSTINGSCRHEPRVVMHEQTSVGQFDYLIWYSKFKKHADMQGTN